MTPQLPSHWPLTEEDLTRINQAIQMIDQYQPHVEKAHRAGVDQTENLARMKESREKLLNLKQHYFPGR